MSDRIAVMQAGRIEQLGGPEDIYRKPTSLFVAQFMGTTNILRGVVRARQGEIVHVRVGLPTCSSQGSMRAKAKP